MGGGNFIFGLVNNDIRFIIYEQFNNELISVSCIFGVVRGEMEKSGMADHIWKEKGNYLPLLDEVKMIDRERHWRIRHLKESAHICWATVTCWIEQV